MNNTDRIKSLEIRLKELPIAEQWYSSTTLDNGVTLLTEPYVDRLIRCNIWHIKGRDQDLLIDTGLGVCSLREAARDLLETRIIAVATHTHYDHIGSHHEFDVRAVHEAEVELMSMPEPAPLFLSEFGEQANYIIEAGYTPDEDLIKALPYAGFEPRNHQTQAAPATWILQDGDVIDLGNRAFEVLHLPGHTPGSIGLWEAGTGILFSGDAIYDGPLLANLPDANINDYIDTMERLISLPVSIVHGGHERSFDHSRLLEIAKKYLESWRNGSTQ